MTVYTPPRFADDVVGRFRSGHTLSGRPAALSEWRITTGDPEVADKVFEVFGGQEPQDWETKGEDTIEVFTATEEVEVIIADASKLRQRMVLWSRAGKLVIDSDGESELSEESRATPRSPEPLIELTFDLAVALDLGRFGLRSNSWSMASDIPRDGTAEAMEAIEGPILATLALEKVSFIAKNGPRAGQAVEYTKPRLRVG